MTIAVTEAIKTIAEAENLFDLSRTEEEAFFFEWQTALSGLSSTDRANLNELRERYIYQRSEGQLLEGTVTLLLASPLLAIAGFYNPPFRVRAEESVQLVLKDSEETLQGRIDVLVLKNRLWVVVLESKKTALSAWAALPQALAYLMANPQPELASFGMVTNGDDIIIYQRSEGQLLEGTVTLLLASPLLAIAGFYNPPFRVRAEESVQLVLKDSEETLQGRIDVLVLKNRLWVVVLESKKTALSAWAALPQALAYLMANPQPELASFGMVTNGDDIIFVKLSAQRQYALSRAFSPLASKQELYSALKILKRIGEIVRR